MSPGLLAGPLDTAVARAVAALLERPVAGEADRLLRDEILAESVVEHLGLAVARERAGQRVPRTPPAVVDRLLTCLLEDLATRLHVRPLQASLPGILEALDDLLRPEILTPLVDDAAASSTPRDPADRLAAPSDDLRAFAAALRQVYREEWEGRSRVTGAEGADNLVRSTGRLLVAASLLDAATSDGGFLVTAARRYAWRWLRLPAPEAASPVHATRTRDLLDRYARAVAAGPSAARRPGGP